MPPSAACALASRICLSRGAWRAAAPGAREAPLCCARAAAFAPTLYLPARLCMAVAHGLRARVLCSQRRRTQ